MKEANKNLLFIFMIIALTIIIPIALNSIPGYLREPNETHIPMQNYLMIVFIVAIVFLIGLPAGFHKLYVEDYTPIKSIWFFAIFGGIVGGLLGEHGQAIMILPYTLLMLIYALFYKKFVWWKVALTTYLGGMLIENAMNHSQSKPLLSFGLLFLFILILSQKSGKIVQS